MHKATSNFQVLAECDNGYIGVCSCCLEFNFAYKTVLLSFQEEEMTRFFDWLIDRRSCPKNYLPMRHGRNRIFSSPNSNLYLTYNDEELDEIIRLYNEARIVLETQRILAQKN
jgi:hypothetical protein